MTSYTFCFCKALITVGTYSSVIRMEGGSDIGGRSESAVWGPFFYKAAAAAASEG